MKFERLLSKANHPVEDQVQWRRFSMKLSPHDSEPTEVEVPAAWSDTAAQICVTKYFRKAGVPSKLARTSHHEVGDATQPPGWLVPSRSESDSAFGSETSARQLFHRLAGHWTYVGWKHGYFQNHDTVTIKPDPEKNARIFYDELYLILANQLAAPNSPQWFNTGLWWAYGIEGPASGQWTVDYAKGKVVETDSAYKFPQPHACFIQPVEDDLVNPGGIMDLWTRESRLFKQGSGTGTNFSTLRAANEPLSGGGRSSGLPTTRFAFVTSS
jgi:ribonucleoside-diphosphate reductase alpha chain